MSALERVLAILQSGSPNGGHRPENPLAEEQTKVAQIRRVQPEDFETILHWASDFEVQRHLDPSPTTPQNWGNLEQVQQAVTELSAYYDNNGEPWKITPLAAVNSLGKVIGVLTMRWRGDPYVPKDKGIASIERLIVDPRMHHKGIATTLVATAIEFAFKGYTGYKGKGANEVRTWIMSDRDAGNWSTNFMLFRKLGFKTYTGPRRHWADFARERRIETTRDALWLTLKPDDWQQIKEEKPTLRGMIKLIEET